MRRQRLWLGAWSGQWWQLRAEQDVGWCMALNRCDCVNVWGIQNETWVLYTPPIRPACYGPLGPNILEVKPPTILIGYLWRVGIGTANHTHPRRTWWRLFPLHLILHGDNQNPSLPPNRKIPHGKTGNEAPLPSLIPLAMAWDVSF